MAPMDRIFVVQQGDYSARRIVAVFSTKAHADDYAKMVTEGGDVEEWPVDTIVPDPSLKLFEAYTRGDGSVEVAGFSTWPSGCPGVVSDWIGLAQSLRVVVQARDEDHATKIAADKFREFVAMKGVTRP
jgi:hypothetical protein